MPDVYREKQYLVSIIKLKKKIRIENTVEKKNRKEIKLTWKFVERKAKKF